jgi:hypothetical protein
LEDGEVVFGFKETLGEVESCCEGNGGEAKGLVKIVASFEDFKASCLLSVFEASKEDLESFSNLHQMQRSSFAISTTQVHHKVPLVLQVTFSTFYHVYLWFSI